LNIRGSSSSEHRVLLVRTLIFGKSWKKSKKNCVRYGPYICTPVKNKKYRILKVWNGILF